ncbi:MAG: hypothetical protein COB67_05685 [SAR324 cluster bacterium]|uniref:Uncharacterized protein n=1 Tax=SAR324 cluster bacterium TaxID=2024889 RepID=A0A2A4T576_9DELT|nr:MAG: hypothetical protein COB67_05685 [SAR324 cluster bacterium]
MKDFVQFINRTGITYLYCIFIFFLGGIVVSNNFSLLITKICLGIFAVVFLLTYITFLVLERRKKAAVEAKDENQVESNRVDPQK